MSTEERESTYRDDITEALVQSVIRRSGHMSRNEAGLWQAAYQDADAVMAVRDDELEQLRETHAQCVKIQQQRLRSVGADCVAAETALADAQKRIEDLSSSVTRVRDLARHPRTSMGRIQDYVLAADVLAGLADPAPGDTPEPEICGFVWTRWDGPYQMNDGCTAPAGHTDSNLADKHGPWEWINIIPPGETP